MNTPKEIDEPLASIYEHLKRHEEFLNTLSASVIAAAKTLQADPDKVKEYNDNLEQASASLQQATRAQLELFDLTIRRFRDIS